MEIVKTESKPIIRNGFEVSAPGKVILHGEHSVVSGHPAVAGPIGLRTFLRYTPLPAASDPSGTPMVVFKFESIPFTISVKLEEFIKFMANVDCRLLMPDYLLERLGLPDKPFPFAGHFSSQPMPEGRMERYSLGAALFVINRVARTEFIGEISMSCFGPGGFMLSFTSEMTIGAGLGSSATFGVCLAACGYALTFVYQEKPFPTGVLFDENVLKKVSRWAFDSEVIMHERPSGLDSTIATYGKLIRFMRNASRHETVNLRHPLHILIIDTGVSRSTAKMLEINTARCKQYPRTMEPIVTAMGALVDEAIALYERDGEESGTIHERLGTLVRINNNLLRSLGVSHPALEKIFTLAELHGFPSKLTGAGGGGCAFVLLPADYRERESYHQFTAALSETGFSTYETTIADGKGVSFRVTEEYLFE